MTLQNQSILSAIENKKQLGVENIGLIDLSYELPRNSAISITINCCFM